eukprot:6173886-Pleurochrysis_carterae.AAC.2
MIEAELVAGLTGEREARKCSARLAALKRMFEEKRADNGCQAPVSTPMTPGNAALYVDNFR